MNTLKDVLVTEFNMDNYSVEATISLLPDYFKKGDFSIEDLRDVLTSVVKHSPLDIKYSDPKYFKILNGHLRFKEDAPAGDVPQPFGYTDYSGLFHGIHNPYRSWNISHWDVSSITNMSHMFCSCEVFSFGDLRNWKTNLVTDMSNMFAYCEIKTDMNISGWNVRSVKSMFGMFYKASIKSTGDLTKWCLSEEADTRSMFNACNSPYFCENNAIKRIY